MTTIKQLRNEIDLVDRQLLSLLEKRVNLAKKIGSIKSLSGENIKDLKRENEMMNELIELGEGKGIDSDSIKKIWSQFFKLSYKVQKEKI